MRALLAAAALMMGMSAIGHAQSDTTRRIPIRDISSGVKKLLPSSIDTSGIESIEVIKGPAAYALYAGQMLPEERRKAAETLEAQRAMWRDRRPRTYLIRVYRDGCIIINTQRRGDTATRRRADSEDLRDQLIVRDTTVIRREPAPINPMYLRTCGTERHVEDLFLDVGTALADTSGGIFNIRYDEVYGFPRSYTVYRGASGHGGVRVLVESFAPVR